MRLTVASGGSFSLVVEYVDNCYLMHIPRLRESRRSDTWASVMVFTSRDGLVVL